MARLHVGIAQGPSTDSYDISEAICKHGSWNEWKGGAGDAGSRAGFANLLVAVDEGAETRQVFVRMKHLTTDKPWARGRGVASGEINILMAVSFNLSVCVSPSGLMKQRRMKINDR